MPGSVKGRGLCVSQKAAVRQPLPPTLLCSQLLGQILQNKLFVCVCVGGGDWSLNLGLLFCKTGTPLLEPRLQSILPWLFWKWDLSNYLSGLALNHKLLDLSLLGKSGITDVRRHNVPLFVVRVGLEFMILLPPSPE
jgi:hypothetical protein